MFRLVVKEEIWRPVVIFTDKGIYDYTGVYEVSNTLKVRRLPYIINSNGRIMHHNGGELTGFLGKGGYYCYHLMLNNERHNFYRSRIVASAFPEICGEWFERAEVDHIDTNKINDIPSNLRFVTCSENHLNPLTIQHMISAKTKQTGKRIIQKTLDGDYIKEYPSIRGACKENNWSQGVIHWALSNPNHTAYGFKFEFI